LYPGEFFNFRIKAKFESMDNIKKSRQLRQGTGITRCRGAMHPPYLQKNLERDHEILESGKHH
jgi:hypothetical protein